MSNDPQPEARWAPIPPAPRNRRRVWIVVGLAAVAVAILGVLLWFLLLRDGAPSADASPMPSATQSDSGPASASPSAEPGTTGTTEPTEEPSASAPPVPDPDMGTFTAQVQPRLDDAATGLDMISESSPADAVQIVDQLQQDADRLAETPAPGSIASSWYAAVGEYSSALAALRSAAEDGAGIPANVDHARDQLQKLRDLLAI